MNQSTIRALSIIELLAEQGPASLATIAGRLDLNKSTAHRFAATLVESGYLRQDPDTRTYHLTTKLVQLASKILERIELGRETHSVLEETATLTAETAHLGILDGLEVVFIDKVQGRQAVEMASRIGSRAACHSTSLGKVLLASRPEGEWRRYVHERGLAPRTRKTITDPERFFMELARVEHQGYAIDNLENEEGIRCVAAPVRDHTGGVVAALSTSGWMLSMTLQRIEQLVPVVTAQAEKASRRLGFGT